MLLVIVYVTDEFVPVKRPDRLSISDKKKSKLTNFPNIKAIGILFLV